MNVFTSQFSKVVLGEQQVPFNAYYSFIEKSGKTILCK